VSSSAGGHGSGHAAPPCEWPELTPSCEIACRRQNAANRRSASNETLISGRESIQERS
jgi:hypothetical protein